MTDRRRVLGLVLQLIAILALTEPLNRFALHPVGDPAIIAPLVLGVVQLVAGWLLVYRPRIGGLAMGAYALLAVAGAVWVVMSHASSGLPAPQAALMDTLVERSAPWLRIARDVAPLVAWPLVGALALRRTPLLPVDPTRQRPEAGGVLIALGATVAGFAALALLGAVMMAGHVPTLALLLGIPGCFNLAIGLFAIRAGRELVNARQHGRSRFTTLLWLGVTGYPIVTIVMFVIIGSEHALSPGACVLSGLIEATARIAPLLVIGAYLGPLPHHAVELGAPNPEAAAVGLRWTMLWLAVGLAAVLPEIFDHRLDGETLGVGIGVIVMSVACAVTAGLTERSSPRRRMWVAIVPAVIAIGLLALTVLGAVSDGGMTPVPVLLVLVALATVPLTLARLDRPSMRGQRGLTSVFE